MKVQTPSSLLARQGPAYLATPPAPPTPPGPAEPKDELNPQGPLPPNTREVRIGHFLKGVTREALEHLRYLSTIYAFNMVGTTAGLVGFTPLAIRLAHDNPAVVGGVAIGGGVLTGGIAALIGYAIEKKRGGIQLGQAKTKPGGLADTALTLGAGLRALPRFIYPTVYGATPAQKDLIYNALDQLPLKDATASATMRVIPNLVETGISGMSQPGLTHTRIILDSGYLDSEWSGTSLVHHENGHAVDYSGGYGLLGPLNWRGPFGKAPFVSQYAGSNRYEDWADSYEAYHHDPADFRARFPDKAAIIEQAAQRTPTEALVDRPGIRSAGRRVGDALGVVPGLRTAMEVGLALMSPIQLHRGARTLEEGYVTADDRLKLQGKMNLMSGLLLAVPGGAPFAVAASALHIGLQQTAGDNPTKLKEANELADKFMAVATGPFGMTAVAVQQELAKAGVDLDKAKFCPGEFNHPVSGGALLKGLLSTVGGAVAGSLIGVTIGNALGGWGGSTIYSLWGRLAGGAIGLAAYGAYRAKHQSSSGEPDPYALTPGDKVFLGKIVGGAVAGAAAGTAAGVFGGRAIGGWLATGMLGPGSDQFGSTVGGWVGALAGSYVLGKAGASLGRHFLKDDQDK